MSLMYSKKGLRLVIAPTPCMCGQLHRKTRRWCAFQPEGRYADQSPAAPVSEGLSRSLSHNSEMHLGAAQQHLLPIASVIAGVFLLVAPRIVSIAVAVYLIFVGLLGLNGIYHLFN